MLIALLFFLLCLVVGSVILTAATASAARARNRYADQQAYLAVSSAARLLKEELSGSAYEVVAYQAVTGQDEDGNDIYEWFTRVEKSPGSNLLTDSVSPYGGVNSAMTGSYTLQVQPDAAGIDAEDLKVDVAYAVDGSYAATFTLCDEKTGTYPMRVIFRADSTEPDAHGAFAVRWGDGVIRKGAA